MASGKTISLFAIIILICVSGSVWAQQTPTIPDSADQDSPALGDSSAAYDSSLAAIFDSTLVEKPAVDTLRVIPDTSLSQYYKSYLTGKGYGEYFWYRPGIMPLQHGSDGHPELLVKSIQLGGSDVSYNGTPLFQQGFYVPFRTGADLDAFMYENVALFYLTPAYNLDLFSQGENLSLNGAVWTPSDNPSSITIAGGPYHYKRSGWRFSRRFNENLSGNLIVGFKKSGSYYQTGGGYNSFGVSGAFAARPKPNAEVTYTFYDHKAEEGLIQFDRIIDPFLQLKRQANFHQLTGTYLLDDNRDLSMKLYYQANHNFIVNDARTYQSRLKDYVSGIQADYRLKREGHHYKLSTGVSYQRLGGVNSDDSKMKIAAIEGSDSTSMGGLDYIKGSIRTRYNTESRFSSAAVVVYGKNIENIGSLTTSAGYYDYLPNLYNLYYNIVIPYTLSGVTYDNFYSFLPNRDLKTKKDIFLSADYSNHRGESINYGLTLTMEKVYNDVLQVTDDSSFTFSTRPWNINYTRLTIAGKADYPLTKYFAGSSGFTLFAYDPSRPLAGIKHSPKALAFTNGRFQLKNVLRDIDLTAAFQVHYVSAREYSGLVRTSYKQAVNLDGSIVIRFGSVEFKVIETNILDFIGGNSYDIWGEYLMPPGNVWWQLTWNFNN
jgi:hypothetical protein